LDGETNKKLKNANSLTNKIYKEPKLLTNFSGKLVCEAPTLELYKCDMLFDHYNEVNTESNQEKIPMTIDNVCLRGMILENT
jgi:hypothetical protein